MGRSTGCNGRNLKDKVTVDYRPVGLAVSHGQYELVLCCLIKRRARELMREQWSNCPSK